MSNSFKSVEKKYFAFSRTIRFVITVLYPIMFLIAPIEYKFLLPFIWLLYFLAVNGCKRFTYIALLWFRWGALLILHRNLQILIL